MDGIIGEIRLWASSFAPAHWVFCEGQLLPISQHTPLFAVIGTTYGGNGVTTFALPDLRGRIPLGTGNGAGLTARALGDVIGTTAATLVENQLPAHRHSLPAVSLAASVGSPVGAHPAASESIKPYAASADGTMAPTAVGAAGGGQSHDNIQPYLALRYIICINGMFPRRW